jgi:hypothetical protein
VLDSGSHIEQPREESADAPEGGEVVGAGMLRVALDVAHGKGDVGARCEAGVCRRGDLRDKLREGGWGLSVRCAVADVGPGVGAEEGEDEDGAEGLDEPEGVLEAKPVAGRKGGRGVARGGGEDRAGGLGHGALDTGSASHAEGGDGSF